MALFVQFEINCTGAFCYETFNGLAKDTRIKHDLSTVFVCVCVDCVDDN